MTQPDDAFLRAMALFRDGRLEEAVASLQAALRRDPDHADALEALGVLYGRQGRLDEAIAVMRRLAEVTPDSVMAHANLSIFYMRQGLKLQAEEEQAVAAALAMRERAHGTPSSSPAQGPAVAERIAKFRDVLALYPDDAQLHSSLGQLYLQDGRPESAILEFSTALALSPETSAVYRLLGQAYEAAHRPAEAQDTYQRGMAVAERRGDLMPLRIMQHRMATIHARNRGGGAPG